MNAVREDVWTLARPICQAVGHDFGPDPAAAWGVCGCGRSLPGHRDSVDSAGGEGCGMTWRVCRRCDHIDEHPTCEHDEHQDDEHDEHQPGGYLCQDVPAGLALPTAHTSV